MLAWNLLPFSVYEDLVPDLKMGFSVWILTGLLLVAGATLVVVHNLRAVLGALMRVFGRSRHAAPVVGTAIAEPIRNRFRTGATIGLFTLVVFTLVTGASISTSFVSALDDEESFGGGYDVTNILLQHGCLLDVVDHAALPSDPRAVDFVLGALDPATAPRPRCLPSAPWVGGLLPCRISNALWRAPASTGGLSATGPDGVTSDGAGDPRAASTPPAAGTDGPESLDSRS